MAVHFGAGNIGRGFLGQLYWESGYGVTFVDVAEPVVAGLHARHAYPLHIVSGHEVRELLVEHVDAIPAGDTAAVAEALARADIASTAVGVNVLPRIAPTLAQGVVRRFSQAGAAPLDIIVCENLIGAGPFLREKVRNHLDPGWRTALETRVGFVEASIGRMVPVMTEAQRARDPLLVCVEPYCELPVDANGFKGEIPAIAHMKPMANFEAYVERKLFVHNLSHAATAYLGHLRGHEYIWQAVEDPAVREKVRGALGESCEALHRKHGLALDGLRAHGEDLLQRYANKALGDQVARVAQDPLRKLGPNDRLAGAARACLEQGITPRHIAFAAAAAMRYDARSDPAATALQDLRRERGIGGVLEEVCRMTPDDPLAICIREADAVLISEGWTNQR